MIQKQSIVERGGDNSWKKCKYLGSLLDTEEDINRRKILAISAYNQLKHIFESKRASLDVKVRLLNSHVRSIFLHNSDLWTISKKFENAIDVFQRNILRKIINVKWPKLYQTINYMKKPR